jgi:hypothetical protein
MIDAGEFGERIRQEQRFDVSHYATIEMARSGNEQLEVNSRGVSSRRWPGERVIMRRDDRLTGDGSNIIAWYSTSQHFVNSSMWWLNPKWTRSVPSPDEWRQMRYHQA